MFKRLLANESVLPKLFIVIAAILWAFDGVIRRSLFDLPPITIVFFEHLVGTLILLPFVFRASRTEMIKPKELGLLSVVALVSGVLGTLWFTAALMNVNFIPFSVVYLILYLEPIFATTSARILLKEKISPRFIKWGAVALVAAFFATFKYGGVNLATGSGTVIAALYALGATAAWGTSTTLSRMTLLKRSDTLVSGWRFLLTTIFALIGVFVLGQQATLTQPTATHFGYLILIALTSGMAALVLYYKGLKKTEAKITTMLELVFPLLAIFFDAVLYKTVLHPSQYLAALVMIFAVYKIAERGNK
ncbi:MAG: DMT family transporter [bacterium]|nr:DMT family transporter [bacterium]